MQKQTEMRKWQERILCILLRWVGGVSLLALVPVFMPHAWMDEIHRSLGMGELPEIPIVGYLTRSLSLFYALMGGLLVLCSFNLVKYKAVLWYLGASFIFFGLAMLGIDYGVGMPDYWKQLEGPYVTIFGILILVLLRNVKREDQ